MGNQLEVVHPLDRRVNGRKHDVVRRYALVLLGQRPNVGDELTRGKALLLVHGDPVPGDRGERRLPAVDLGRRHVDLLDSVLGDH